MKRILGLLLLLCGPGVNGQTRQTGSQSVSTPETAAPQVLTGLKPVLLGAPIFNFSGEPVCDGLGDLYFEATNPNRPVFGMGPFLRFKADGSSHALFSIPADILAASAGKPFSAMQTVSPGGSYYLLTTDFDRYTLVAYKENGEVKSAHSLQIPARVSPEMIAITDSGVLYVRGYVEGSESQTKPRKGYAALMSESGRPIRDLSLGMAEVNIASIGSHPQEGYLTAADDGRFYLLTPENIVVKTKAAKLYKRFLFASPIPVHMRCGLTYRAD